MFNGDDTNVHFKTIDYVGCGGVSSTENPFSNLPPLAKRRGIFAELIGHQSHRNSAILMNGYSNSIMMWESAGALHYRAGERRKRGLEWQPYLANNNFVLSGDADSGIRACPECRNRFGVLTALPIQISFVGLRPTISVLWGGSRVLAHQTFCEKGHKAHLRVRFRRFYLGGAHN
jgi:hypothetical protein